MKMLGEIYETGKKIELPSCFSTPVRLDLIREAFRTEQINKAQPYGTYPLAGKKGSGKVRHRRHKYKTLYGMGISRIPRTILTRRGERFYFKGAFIPGTVGGRAAHPPKAVKKRLKMNKKVKKLALDGAIAATASLELIKKRYKKIGNLERLKLPLIIDSSMLEKKPKEIIAFLEKMLGFTIKREKKVRAGKGKMRGRCYKKRCKVLLVGASSENVKRLRNYIDVAQTNHLNLSIIAPGGTPGRIIVWTTKAIEELKKK